MILKLFKFILVFFGIILSFFEIILTAIKTAFENIKTFFAKILKKFIDFIKIYFARKEEIKLLEAGKSEQEENNIIQEVFESEMSKLENEDEIKYQKKLDEIKENMQINPVEEVKKELVRPRTNFTPIEEKKEENEEKSKEDSKKIIGKQLSVEEQKEISELENQKVDTPKNTIKVKPKYDFYESNSDFGFNENQIITEEMIRQQVELEDMVRMSEWEEELENITNAQNKRGVRDKFHDFKDRQREKIKNFSDKRKDKKAAKKELKQLKRQKIKEEAKINEELLEDNLYPKPKM